MVWYFTCTIFGIIYFDYQNSNDSLGCYCPEIQLMMHGCGDCAKPLQSTAKVVASIVQQQALNIAWRAEEQAIRRGFKTVTPRDIIFLMRNNPDKLRRLYSYLCVYLFLPNFHIT